MLDVLLVEATPLRRTTLAEAILTLVGRAEQQHGLVSPLRLDQRGPHELGFRGAPELCVVGPDLARDDIAAVAAVRGTYPQSRLAVIVPGSERTLALTEQLARLGVDDVVDSPEDGQGFLHLLVMVSRRKAPARKRRLVTVDSGKGGTGVTTVVSALGEALASSYEQTLLVDLDFRAQSLTRFLQVRPFVNESLQELLEGTSALTAERLANAAQPVWPDWVKLMCLPPPFEQDSLYEADAPGHRRMLSALDALADAHEITVVDLAGARGPLMRALIQRADTHLAVVSADPSCVPASIERLRHVESYVDRESRILIVENNTTPPLLRRRRTTREIVARLHAPGRVEEVNPIAFDTGVAAWPATGMSALGCASRATRRALEELARTVRQAKGGDSTRTVVAPAVPLLGFFRRLSDLRSRRIEAPDAGVRDPLPERPALPWLAEPLRATGTDG